MTIVSPAELVSAKRNGGAVAAFNVIMLEHVEAFIAAAELQNSGVILQLSQNAVRYHGSLGPFATAILAHARETAVPVAVQLDHADDLVLVREAAALGFTSIMFDASTLAFDENLRLTRAVTEELHDSGVWVEAELGEIGGKENAGAHAPGARTDPGDAVRFVAGTGVDGLAVAVGSSHAMLDQSAQLDLRLIRSLAEAVPVPLVLHGASGVGDEVVLAACEAGISKVNFGTRFNMTLTGEIREVLGREPRLVDPRKYLAPGRHEMQREAQQILALLAGVTLVP